MLVASGARCPGARVPGARCPGARCPVPGARCLKELRGPIELKGLIDLIALIGLIGLTGRAHRPISQEINTSLDQKKLVSGFSPV